MVLLPTPPNETNFSFDTPEFEAFSPKVGLEKFRIKAYL
jgi:hypothetical protein